MASHPPTSATDASSLQPPTTQGRHGSVSTQLQDWLAARSLAISLPSRLSPRPRFFDPKAHLVPDELIDPMEPIRTKPSNGPPPGVPVARVTADRAPVELEPVPQPKKRRERKPKPVVHSPSSPFDVINFSMDATETLSCASSRNR